ncbi:MAG: hypothetical protein J6Y20_10805 [Lachnospiraceae bacterium]|nr:hypothetical protein [Lachnospiraceae bacterium]
MTRDYTDELDYRCPHCGTPVRLIDTECPHCEHGLSYGRNIKKSSYPIRHKYQRLPRWMRAFLLAAVLTLLVIAIIQKSILLGLLFCILFYTLLTLGSRGNLAILFFGRLGLGIDEMEPWDSTLAEPRSR